MPTIIRPDPPQQSELGRMINQLGKQMFGDRLGNDLRREKLYGLQRENRETDNLMAQVAKGGAAAAASSPIAQAILIGAGYDPRDFAQLGLLDSAVNNGARAQATQNLQVGAGQSFSSTAEAFDATQATARRGQDLTDARGRRGQDMASADRRYNTDQTVATTARGQDLTDARGRRGQDIVSADKRYEFDNTLVEALSPDGRPTFTRRNDVEGYSPMVSETDTKGHLLRSNWDSLDALNAQQQEVLGARIDGNSSDKRAPRNYIAPDGTAYITQDGRTDVQTGQPLPPGGRLISAQAQGDAGDIGWTNSVQTDLQTDLLKADRFDRVSQTLLDKTNDPTLFGLIGKLRSKGQEAVQAANALVTLMGGEGSSGADTLRAARADLAQNGLQGLLPELYDPELPEVEMLGGLMLYMGASALAGQENRSVSDKDIALMKQIMGEPHSIFSSAESVKAKIMAARSVVLGDRQAAAEALGMSDSGVQTPSAEPEGDWGIQPGHVEDGWVYRGGDPADQANWEQVQ